MCVTTQSYRFVHFILRSPLTTQYNQPPFKHQRNDTRLYFFIKYTTHTPQFIMFFHLQPPSPHPRQRKTNFPTLASPQQLQLLDGENEWVINRYNFDTATNKSHCMCDTLFMTSGNATWSCCCQSLKYRTRGHEQFCPMVVFKLTLSPRCD